MTHLVLPQMVERKKGAIVNVSAGGCTRPTPQMGVYSATKVCQSLSKLTVLNFHTDMFMHYQHINTNITYLKTVNANNY